nr:MAG TPA: hypothetical protein [Caudoviricetes sp.]
MKCKSLSSRVQLYITYIFRSVYNKGEKLWSYVKLVKTITVARR